MSSVASSLPTESTSVDVALKIHQQQATRCDCVHDYSPLAHYLSLPTVNVLSGDASPRPALSPAEPCFRRADWQITVRGESPDGYVPPSTRHLCTWCKDHWERFGAVENRFERIR